MLDRDLAAVARRQRGVITQPQLDDLGASKRQRQRRLDSGALERLHESVLAVAGAPMTWERDATAALAASPAAVLGHTGAARVHRMRRVERSPRVSILAPFGAYHELEGVEVRRTRFLPESHVTVVDGLRVTTRARTIIDLAADVGEGRLRSLIEDEIDRGRVTWEELTETFGQLATRGRPGIGKMRRVMERIEGRPPTESELERMYLRLLASAGLPLPTMQVAAPWSDAEPGRVDGMYADQRSIIDLDGRTFHQRSLAFGARPSPGSARNPPGLSHHQIHLPADPIGSEPRGRGHALPGLPPPQLSCGGFGPPGGRNPPQFNRGGRCRCGGSSWVSRCRATGGRPR